MRCSACGRDLRRESDRFRAVPLCDEHLDVMNAAAERMLARAKAEWDGEERRASVRRGFEIDHLDGDPRNNDLDNLEVRPARVGVGSDGIARPLPHRDLTPDQYAEIVGPRETGEWG